MVGAFAEAIAKLSSEMSVVAKAAGVGNHPLVRTACPELLPGRRGECCRASFRKRSSCSTATLCQMPPRHALPNRYIDRGMRQAVNPRSAGGETCA
jgi:hypothetical protein